MRRHRTATAVALAMLLTPLGCAPGGGQPPSPAAAPAPPSGEPCARAPALTTLDWETARQQGVPDDPPPGWSAEYDKGLVHRDGRPQVQVVRAPEPVRAGGAAARFELRRDDPVINEGTRAELAAPPEPRGADRWYALSVYLPPSWARDRSPEIIAQWHQHHTIDGNPPLAIATYQGQWEVLTAWGPKAEVMAGAHRTGRWTDWLVHVKWSTGADGVVQVWKDGKPVAGFGNRHGRNAYPGPHGNYLKVGIYKWDWSQRKPTDTTQRFLYLDEVRIADTRAGVAIPQAPAEAC
jgi:hypothetical protein